MKAKQKILDKDLDSYPLWVKSVWVTARGEPLDFEDHKYLVDIYQDQFPNIVYQKAAQMGLSERLISEAVWICDRLKKIVLYTFPTSSQLSDFVQARLEPVFMFSDYLSRITGSLTADEKKRRNIDETDKVKKVGLKQIGQGFIYLRGSQNQQQIISVDADCVFLDERDRFIQEHVPYIDKRLLHSTLKWRREASTPTFPGMGISEAYLASDQRVWMIKCDYCKLEQELDFFFNIDYDKKITICKQCKKEIDRFKRGRWITLKPENNQLHGYKINGIYNPRRNIAELIDSYEKAKVRGFSAMQQFYNQTLGVPYESEGTSLLISDLNNCRADFEIARESKSSFAGADIGQLIHVVIAEKTQKTKYVYIGNIHNFLGPTNSLEALIVKYNIKILVVDAHPDTRKVRELIERFPKIVYAAYYPPRKFDIQNYYIFDDIRREVSIDRTISLDYLVSEIQNKIIELPVNAQYIPEFYQQMASCIRQTQVNPRNNQPEARWIERGPDHFFHAANYCRIATCKGDVAGALLESYNTTETKKNQDIPTDLFSIARWVRLKGERIF